MRSIVCSRIVFYSCVGLFLVPAVNAQKDIQGFKGDVSGQSLSRLDVPKFRGDKPTTSEAPISNGLVERSDHSTRNHNHAKGYEYKVGEFRILDAGVWAIESDGSHSSRSLSSKKRKTESEPFIYDQLATRFTFSSDINSPVVVEQSREGVFARSAVAGIQYIDGGSGKEQLIAWVKSSTPVELDNGVLYEDAFVGVVADIRYVLSFNQLQQDVILYEIPDPALFDMDIATVRIRILTEIMTSRVDRVFVERDEETPSDVATPAALQIFADVGGQKERLFNLQRGYAYPQLDGMTMGGHDSESRRILDMRIVRMNGRLFVAEELPVAEIVKAIPSVLVNNIRPEAAETTDVCPPERPIDMVASSLAMAPFERKKDGYIIDYINWYATVTNAVTLESGVTYLITNSLAIDGSNAVLTIEPGAIVKFGTNAFISMQNGARLISRAHLLDPAIFTSAHDDSCGEPIPGYTNSPANNKYPAAFELAGGTNLIEGVRIKYATSGIKMQLSGQTIRHSIIEKGWQGVEVSSISANRSVTIKNVLFNDLQRGVTVLPVTNNLFYYFNNNTMDDVREYGISSSGGISLFYISCSLFASVTNQVLIGGGYSFSSCAVYNSPTQSLGSVKIVSSNPFLAGTYGEHYINQTTNLVNGGYLPAGSYWGLFHYTTATNHIKESNTVVDIGFHYPAPVDTDGDGLYDHQEDTDGSGTYNAGDYTDFTNADTDGDGMSDGWEVEHALNPVSGLHTSMVGWWRFDDASGTNALNSARTNYHGQLVNLATSAWVAGKLGGSLQFDGDNDYVRVPQSPVLITGQQFTASGWAYLDTTDGDNYPSIISDFDLCSYNYDGFWLGWDNANAGVSLFGANCAGPYIFLVDDQSITGNWHHVATTFDGTNGRVYLDGVQVVSGTGTIGPANQSEIRIGWANDTSATYYWDGKLDDIRLYTSALSSNSIAGMYDAFLDPDGDGYTNLDEYNAGTDPAWSNPPPTVVVTYPYQGVVLP